MKRGKDDEKIMGPMFPRLHVNDTEKGGPRAPPRNKMALYEQLTIPSHRYNPSVVPLNPNKNNLIPSASTSQGPGYDRSLYTNPFYRSSLAPPYSVDKPQIHLPDAVRNRTMEQIDQSKKPEDEDDFRVPIFSQPGAEQRDSEGQSIINLERSVHLVRQTSTCINETNEGNGSDFISEKHVRKQYGNNTGDFDASVKHSLDLRQSAAAIQESQEKNTLGQLRETDVCLQQDPEAVLPVICDEAVSDEPLKNAETDIPSRMDEESHLEVGYGNDNSLENVSHMCREEIYHSIQRENADRDDDASETSMVDSASALDISPDDVVAVIGRKHFWKARAAIATQQRVFAFQVFELHRLIKVQKLIAGSPHLLLEASAFVGKPALKASFVKKFPSDYAVKTLRPPNKRKDECLKPNNRTEGSAENTVSKTSIPSQTATQNAPFLPNQISSPSLTADTKLNPWCFTQPAPAPAPAPASASVPHQWLVPVMSPSEGLIYKPYPGPRFMGPVCGGCGPVGPTHMMGNFVNPGYGLPGSPHYHHHQGLTVPPAIPFNGQGYCPPYSMPVMNSVVSGSAMDQTNPIGPNPGSQTGQPEGISETNDTNSPNAKIPISKASELQGSTASSPSDRAQDVGPDTLPLFPAAEVPERGDQRARVIRVVPHNPRSTRVSAARIFQSIQEERRQHKTT